MKKLEDFAAVAEAYTSDSREFKSGDIFVAIKGATYDGHKFVDEILKKEPTAIVVDSAWMKTQNISDARVVAVEDVHEAHRNLAALFRKKFKGKVIAVGGSNGKTTTKEFLYALLAQGFKTVKTDKSQNGELGIPKTLEKLRPGVEVAVIEVGIDAPGDMARHESIVAPDVAVLTSIGEEHLNLLGTVENVFKEESILFERTKSRGGKLFAPKQDVWLKKIAGAQLIPPEPESVDPSFKCLLSNKYARQNAALAAAVAKAMGLSDAHIREALLTLQPPEGRGIEMRVRPDFLVVADHYNANLASMRAGIAHARAIASQEKLPLHLVLGDMLDQGDQAERVHRELAKEISKVSPESLVLVGPQLAAIAKECKVSDTRCFAEADKAASAMKETSPKRGVILLKGSRGMTLEKILPVLK